MPLFVCDKCICIENTVFGRYWSRNIPNMWNDEDSKLALCSECAPVKFKNGSDSGHTGKWHGKFPKQTYKDFMKDHTNKDLLNRPKNQI